MKFSPFMSSVGVAGVGYFPFGDSFEAVSSYINPSFPTAPPPSLIIIIGVSLSGHGKSIHWRWRVDRPTAAKLVLHVAGSKKMIWSIPLLPGLEFGQLVGVF